MSLWINYLPWLPKEDAVCEVHYIKKKQKKKRKKKTSLQLYQYVYKSTQECITLLYFWTLCYCICQILYSMCTVEAIDFLTVSV